MGSSPLYSGHDDCVSYCAQTASRVLCPPIFAGSFCSCADLVTTFGFSLDLALGFIDHMVVVV